MAEVDDSWEVIEHNYKPRELAREFHNRKSGLLSLAHRRFGKTVAAVNDLVTVMFSDRSAQCLVAYIAPYLSLKPKL